MICVVFFRHYDNTIHCPLTKTIGAFNIFTTAQNMYQGHRKIKPKCMFGENAPRLFSPIGFGVVDKLRLVKYQLPFLN